MVAVLAHEGQVGLDVGPQLAGAGRLGIDLGLHVRHTPGHQLGDQFPDELVLAAEVVDDHALAGARGLGDTGQRGLSVPQLGDGVDGGRHDLGAACGLGEGPGSLLTDRTAF